MFKLCTKYHNSLIFFFLLFIGTITSFLNPDYIFLLSRLFIIVLLSISLEYLFKNIIKTSSFSSIQNVSFSVLIFLISGYHTNIFLLAFAVIVSHVSYHYLKYKGMTTFNPVTLGVFSLSLFGLKTTWWGINSGFLIILLMIIFGIIINYYNGSLRITALYFLFVIIFSFLFSFNPLYSIKQIFSPGLLFFGFYILHLSLKNHNSQSSLNYAAIASLLAVTIPKFGIFTDPLITSFVLTDFLFFAIKLLIKNKNITN